MPSDFVVWATLLTLCLWTANGIEFNMIFLTKCISEEVPANTQVELEYLSYDKTDETKPVGTKLLIESPGGQTMHDAPGDSGNITFKATDAGNYKACFNVPSNLVASRVKLRVEWRLGATSIDWDVVAKKEHLDEIDGYMKRFTTTIKKLNDELKEIRVKETEMRQITEATNTRVALVSWGCVFICVAITIGQVWYLRRFFTKKKII